MKKKNLRRMWEEEVPFKYKGTDTEEKNSIEKYCINSGYKYFSHFVYGNKYKFNKTIIEGNAVSLKYYNTNIYKEATYRLVKWRWRF